MDSRGNDGQKYKDGSFPQQRKSQGAAQPAEEFELNFNDDDEMDGLLSPENKYTKDEA